MAQGVDRIESRRAHRREEAENHPDDPGEADRQGDDVRTVLARGDRGFLLFADHGDALDMPADVYPAEVSSLGKVRSVTDTDLQITVMFAITKQPAEDISLPAPTP